MLELTYPNGTPVRLNPYAVVSFSQAHGKATCVTTTAGEFTIKETLEDATAKWLRLMEHFTGHG